MSTSTDAKFVVGIGASAGGLEPLEQFFSEMPHDSGLAFVVVQHLSPSFKSLMDELLARHTQMKIHRVEHGMPVEVNSIYLIPPSMEMTIKARRLYLQQQKRDDVTPQLPIDVFFNALAEDLGIHAIGIVMSGTGSDGSRGIQAIKEHGGFTVAQDHASAKFDGMPRSSIDTGAVDCILPPVEMPAAIQDYVEDPERFLDQEAASDEGDTAHERVLQLLRDATELDFSQYKPSTVRRRIDRRIQLSNLPSVDVYAKKLEDDAAEVHQLYRDLLIGVTRFFRDREAFRRIEENVIPEILSEDRAQNDEVRVWIAGCATGEEAYSIAILLHEKAARLSNPPRIRIFATDAHRTSLEVASLGRYGRDSLSEVTPARLERYFSPVGDEFQVSSELRQLLTFAPQNLLQDAPFTRIDLLTCRNLLIYLQLPAQARVLHLFHFALKVGGVMFLGPSETMGDLKSEFASIDNHWRVYRKRREVRLTADSRVPAISGLPRQPRPMPLAPATPSTSAPDLRLIRAYDTLLDQFVPAAILVNERREVIHTFGTARELLNPPRGRITLDVLELVDPGIKVALGAAIQRASRDQDTVRYRHVKVGSDGPSDLYELTVKPIPDKDAQNDSMFCLVILEQESRPEVELHAAVDVSTDTEDFDASREAHNKISTLETELQYTKENLQATIEEMETSNEELNAANEELIASNEELQSTNEELHSVNEELYTVNSEYQRKITELTEVTDDINNLLASTDIAVIFLDRDFCIRRFTPAASDYFSLREQDISRPLAEITHTLEDDRILDDVRRVLDIESSIQREVSSVRGPSLLLRILPYRSSTGRTDGVVLTLIDTTLLSDARKALESVSARFEAFMENSPALNWALDADGRLAYVNEEYERCFGVSRRDVLGSKPTDVLPQAVIDAFDRGEKSAASAGQTATAEDEAVRYFEVDMQLDGESRALYVSNFAFHDATGAVLMGGSALDVSDLRRLESERDEVLVRYELAMRGARLGAWEWNIVKGSTHFTETFYTMLGYESGELPMQLATWKDLLHPADLPSALHSLNQYVDGDAPAYRCPHRLRRKDGTYAWVVGVGEITGRGEDGKPIRMTILHIDIDDLKQAELALESLNSELVVNNGELAARNHELDQFAHAASHDLRSPLRTVTGFAEIMRESITDGNGKGTSDALDRIEDAARRMGQLIDSLLLFASVGRGEAITEVVDLSQTLDQVLADIAPEIEACEGVVEASGTLPKVTGDPAMLRQLLQNLISNAVKYRRDVPLKVTVDGRTVGQHVSISVSDNGVGIPSEDADRAFEPFQRLHGGQHHRGSGLGLSICRRVVERHGGSIRVESEPNVGSTFYVVLPSAEHAMAVSR